MPIYEFYCPDCHTVFNFFSHSVNTTKKPSCPLCGRKRLGREVSLFAMAGNRKNAIGDDDMDLPVDEARMESAIGALASEAEGIDEDDPRQAANLMRKFSDMTGMQLGGGMQEALARMEAGEDPEVIEAELGELIESEEPFQVSAGGPKQKGGKPVRGAPRRDQTLYDL